MTIPGNVMNRLTPVVNQDPHLPVVFDQLQPVNTGGLASLTMTGRILDTQEHSWAHGARRRCPG